MVGISKYGGHHNNQFLFELGAANDSQEKIPFLSSVLYGKVHKRRHHHHRNDEREEKRRRVAEVQVPPPPAEAQGTCSVAALVPFLEPEPEAPLYGDKVVYGYSPSSQKAFYLRGGSRVYCTSIHKTITPDGDRQFTAVWQRGMQIVRTTIVHCLTIKKPNPPAAEAATVGSASVGAASGDAAAGRAAGGEGVGPAAEEAAVGGEQQRAPAASKAMAKPKAKLTAKCGAKSKAKAAPKRFAMPLRKRPAATEAVELDTPAQIEECEEEDEENDGDLLNKTHTVNYKGTSYQVRACRRESERLTVANFRSAGAGQKWAQLIQISDFSFSEQDHQSPSFTQQRFE